ncbi:hypothetical protein [Microbacterium sp. NPDC058389]|uniref:hypothetical protein n=1 Tax=Microbacterium sp. NPDC058389 TaxID=3346475 RepID=UPI003650FC87
MTFEALQQRTPRRRTDTAEQEMMRRSHPRVQRDALRRVTTPNIAVSATVGLQETMGTLVNDETRSVDHDRRFELTTSLSFPMLAPSLLDELAAKLDDAVFEETGEVPAATAYFVAVDHETAEITIGLRFEGMDARYITETASEMLEAALTRLSGQDGPRLTPVREDSMLVPA